MGLSPTIFYTVHDVESEALMSRQLEQAVEERERLRSDNLFRALEFGLVGALQTQGIELLGFSMKYQDFSCLLTLRVISEESRKIAHVGSDTMTNCFLKADLEARHHRLRWAEDKYHPDKV